MFPLSRDCLGPCRAFSYCLQLSQVHIVLRLCCFFLPMQCANVKLNRGYAFNTVCFINTGIASSDVNVFCWTAVWIQVLAVTGCLVMVLSCGSESWTCGLWLWSRIWLEDMLENSRVAVGYKSLSPRYSLSCPLVHYMLFIHPCFCPYLPLTPTTTISTAFIVAPCLSFPFSVLFVHWRPTRRNDSLEYFQQS